MNPKALRAYPRGVLHPKQYEPGRRAEADPRARLADLVVAAYADPEPFDTAEAFSKHHHDDIAQLDLESLDRERLRARFRWAFDAAPSDWLRERLARLDAEADRRRRATR